MNNILVWDGESIEGVFGGYMRNITVLINCLCILLSECLFLYGSNLQCMIL